MPTIYDQVHYPGFPYAQSHPDRLATLATIFGMNPQPLDRCRVLELGCGDGANIIPMAFEFGASEFVGIDLAESMIAEGRSMAEALNLRNLRLEAADIMRLGEELGEFDYIIAHGVYSWVPEDVRDRVLAIAHDRLKPQGVAYVSYNALPGCHTRLMLRDAMLYRLRDVKDPQDRAEKGYKLLEFLAEAPTAGENPAPAVIRQEARIMLERSPQYVFHDELGETYFPIYFSDFLSHAARHDLHYLSEANIYDMDTAKFAPELREQLTMLSEGGRLEREQYMDFLKGRQFRQTLLRRSETATSDEPLVESVSKLYATTAAKLFSSAKDAAGQVVEEYRGFRSAAMKTAHPLARAAVGRLAELWPEAIHFRDLLAHCREKIGAEKADPADLAEILLMTYRTGLVDLHTTPRNCVSRPGSFPTVNRMVRWQAQHRLPVTTSLHTTVDPTGELERDLLVLLDGTRNRDALVKELRMVIEPPPPMSKLFPELEKNLEKLAKFGLLVA